jgi:predicted nucleic acid-binding protein
VIYIDSSVALAHLLAEPHSPPATLWKELLVSSRLLEYEIWNRINTLGQRAFIGDDARSLLDRTYLHEMNRLVLERALAPWPTPIRTLDALHIATLEYLRRGGEAIELATYDHRMIATASALGIPIAAL